MEALWGGDIYGDPEFKPSSKIPSLLSTHLNSPLRINSLEYCRVNWNLLSEKTSYFKNQPKHPYAFNYVIKDLKFLIDNRHITRPSIMNAGHFGLLNNKPLERIHLNSNFLLLEKFVNVSIRNLDLQLKSTRIKNNIFNESIKHLDLNTPNFPKENVLYQKLNNIIHNQGAIVKNMPPLILHQFSWYNILHQAIILTGLVNQEDNLLNDKKRFKNVWTLINEDHLHQESDIYFMHQSNLKLYASRNLFLVITDKGESVLGTREHLLMMADTFVQRFNLYLSGYLAEQIGYKHYLYMGELSFILSWGDKLLSSLHDSAFDILSKWEPLCVGTFLKYSDDELCDGTSFLRGIQKELQEEFSELTDSIQQSLIDLESFLYKIFTRSYHKLSQAFGLFRIWGHPNIDSRKGILKLKQIAQQRRIVNKKKVRQIFCIFMEKFCLDYRAKKGMWPNMCVNLLRDTNHIRRAVESNSIISLTSPYYNRQDWIKVSFKKTFDISDKLNLSDLLSDKALSLTLHELYDQVHKHNNIGLATEKSVIIQWLKSKLHDPEQFLDEININGFGEDNEIFGVCPKERELKLIARFFGLATLKKRMYIVLTEAMIAEYIIPHFPQITMMDDSITLSKKFFDQTKIMASDTLYGSKRSYKNIVTNIDFQKWNTYMRKEETYMIFQQMDKLFGYDNCISRTHEMFETAQLYLADGTFVPNFTLAGGKLKLVECDYVWTNHLGGIEGLRQKGWTIFTVCVLISVMELHPNSRFSLMGQGDNQVLIVHYSCKYDKETIKKMHLKMIETLDSELKLIGPPLKKEETWSSSSLFIYGKFIIYNGCPLSLSQKKLCRYFPMSNEGFPTIETAISSISANCSAASSSDISPIIPFLMCGFWYSYVFHEMLKINYLGLSLDKLLFQNSKQEFSLPHSSGTKVKHRFKLSHDHVSCLKEVPSSLLSVLLLFPKCLGGYPISFLSNYMIKGFPDPLTEYLANMKMINGYLTKKEEELIQNIISPNINSDPNYEYLFSNPTGLNLLSPTTPGDVVKSTVTRFIHECDWIENDYVKEFLVLSHDNQKDLVTALSYMAPLNPLIGHAILESTIIGRAHQVMEQLNKTSTLIKITAKNGDDLLGRVKFAESNYLMSVLYHIFFKSDYKIDLDKCSRVEAQRLREISWDNTNITGVTVPYPVEFLEIEPGFDCTTHLNSGKGYILLKQTIQNPDKLWYEATNIGDAIPYIGSRTIDKVKAYGNKVAKTSSPLLKKVAKMQSLIGWATERDSNLSKCIQRLLSSVTDLPPELLNPDESSISGSVEHRLSSDAVNRGGNVEVLFNFGTYLSLATDTFTAYAKGSINVNLHFQAALSYGTSWFSILRSLNCDTYTTCYHMHQDCNDCIIPINETKIEVNENDWSNLIKSKPESSFCWIAKEKILGKNMKISSYYPEFTKNLLNDSSLQYNHMLRSCRAAAKETMVKFRQLSLEVGDGKMSARSGWIFPVSWVFKLDPLCFFYCLLAELKSFFIFRQFETKLILSENQNSINKDFQVFLKQIPPIVFGMFSSWFQNSNFLDFISGLPYFIKPPLKTTFTRSSCGVCIQFLLKRIICLLDEDQADLSCIKRWNMFFTGGDESLDSNPLIMAIVWADLFDNRAISNVPNHRMILLLKRCIPDLMKEDTQIAFDFRPLLSQNVQNYASFLSIENIKLCIKFLNKLEIYHSIETGDGLISELSVFSYTTPVYQLKARDFMSLPILCQGFSISPNDVIKIPHVIRFPDITECNVSSISLEGHMQKPITYPTTSQYKLLSILRLAEISLSADHNVGCFGDGAGGFSKLMIDTYSCKVFYNSLIDTANLFQNALGNQYPPVFAGSPVERENLINLNFTYQYISDLTHPLYANKYIEFVKVPLTVMICDAEGGGWKNNKKAILMLKNLLKIAKHSKSVAFIFKSYFSNWDGFKDQLLLIQMVFKNVCIIRSLFSSKNSTEVYIMGSTQQCDYGPCDFFDVSLEEIKIPISFTTGFNGNLGTLSNFINRLASSEHSNKYTQLLSSKLHEKQNLMALINISSSLFSNNGIYKFPYQYLLDCRQNTHLTKYTEKYRKITKINVLTTNLVEQILSGYLTILLKEGTFSDVQMINKIFDYGVIVFYQTYNYLWSFALAQLRDVMNTSISYYRISAIIDTPKRKNIFSKIAKLRQTNKIIKYNLLIPDFPYSTPAISRDRHGYLMQFHNGFTPLQFALDRDINKRVLKIRECFLTPKYLKYIKLCQDKWIVDKTGFFKSNNWLNI